MARCGCVSPPSFKRRGGVTEIFLEEDVYVVLGDSGQSSTTPSAWPAAGSYGPVPKNGIAGRPEEVLGSIGPELWKAKRKGRTVCLVGRCEHYGPATALLWAADCVEHFAKRVQGVDGNVVEALVLARRYASDRIYNPEQAHALIAEIDKLLKRLRRGGLADVASTFVAPGLDGDLRMRGSLLDHAELAYDASAMAEADLRAMQVALLHAARALCGADPLVSAREAAHWCREAAGRNELAKQAGYRAREASESSWLSFRWNPFAPGALSGSLPAQVKALKDGSEPETAWQAAQLLTYLDPPAADHAQAS